MLPFDGKTQNSSQSRLDWTTKSRTTCDVASHAQILLFKLLVITKHKRMNSQKALSRWYFWKWVLFRLLGCDFENGLCPGWYQSKMDDFDWTRRSGRTPSFSTGPSSGHGGYGEFVDDTTCGNAFRKLKSIPFYYTFFLHRILHVYWNVVASFIWRQG